MAWSRCFQWTRSELMACPQRLGPPVRSRLMLKEEVILAVVVDQPVGVVEPLFACREMKLRPVLLVVRVLVLHNGSPVRLHPWCCQPATPDSPGQLQQQDATAARSIRHRPGHRCSAGWNSALGRSRLLPTPAAYSPTVAGGRSMTPCRGHNQAHRPAWAPAVVMTAPASTSRRPQASAGVRRALALPPAARHHGVCREPALTLPASDDDF